MFWQIICLLKNSSSEQPKLFMNSTQAEGVVLDETTLTKHFRNIETVAYNMFKIKCSEFPETFNFQTGLMTKGKIWLCSH